MTLLAPDGPVGQVFGRLTVEAVESRTRRNGKHREPWARCRCRCGGAKWTRLSALRAGSVRSCGCLSRELSSERKRTHGMKGSRAYGVWCQIVQRCTNPNDKGFRNYGGRGVAICAEWRASFDAFLRDMGPKPSPKHSIDRIDNDGPYAPWNCRWATRSEQELNKRKRRGTASSYRGVYPSKGGNWRAAVKMGPRQFHIGIYASETEAARARDVFMLARCDGSFPLNVSLHTDLPEACGDRAMAAALIRELLGALRAALASGQIQSGAARTLLGEKPPTARVESNSEWLARIEATQKQRSQS